MSAIALRIAIAQCSSKSELEELFFSLRNKASEAKSDSERSSLNKAADVVLMRIHSL